MRCCLTSAWLVRCSGGNSSNENKYGNKKRQSSATLAWLLRGVSSGILKSCCPRISVAPAWNNTGYRKRESKNNFHNMKYDEEWTGISELFCTFAAEDITSRSPSIDGEVGSLTGMRDAGWAMLLSSTGMSAGEPSFWLSGAVPGSSNRRRTG